jgi:hypothetical protein
VSDCRFAGYSLPILSDEERSIPARGQSLLTMWPGLPQR